MNPGALRHLVTIERPVVTQSDSGAEIATFGTVCKAFASVEPLSGREALQAGQITAEVTTRITLRWQPALDAISAKWRVRHAGIVYDITQPAHLKLEQREVELMCSSGMHA
jgi:SPP1 family predicted phage head-tail adaptor